MKCDLQIPIFSFILNAFIRKYEIYDGCRNLLKIKKYFHADKLL